MNIPLRDIFKKHCPFIFEFISGNDKTWIQYTKDYQNRIGFIKSKTKVEGKASFQLNFMDNLLLSKLGNKESIMFLSCTDTLVYQTVQQIPNELDGKLKKLINNWFHSSDKDRITSYDFIGELFVIDYYLKNDFSLGAIEVELPDMRPIDFLFKDNLTNECHLIEVMNIHPIESKIDSIEGLKTFFKDRFLQKYGYKTKGDINKGQSNGLKLFPIIWISDPGLIVSYSEFFQDTITDISEEIHILQGYKVSNDFNYYSLVPISHVV